MKKIVKRLTCVLLMGAMMVMFTACGVGKQTATCTAEQNGVAMEIVIEAYNDIIQKWTQTSTISLEGVDDDTMAYLNALIETSKAMYAPFEKVSYTTTTTDTEMVEVVVIDMSDSDTIKSLVEEGLLPVEGNASKLSLKLTVEGFEKQGYTVTIE